MVKWIVSATLVILASILYVLFSGPEPNAPDDTEDAASVMDSPSDPGSVDALPFAPPSGVLYDSGGNGGVGVDGVGAGSGPVEGAGSDRSGSGSPDGAAAAPATQAPDPGAAGPVASQRTEARPTAPRSAPQPTYDVVVYAVNGDLNPVMVWTDMKPATDFYRVPKGDALRFQAVGSVRIQGQYADMMVFINGRHVANVRELHYDRSQRMIDIGRSTLREFGTGPAGTALSLPEGVEPPRSITAAQR